MNGEIYLELLTAVQTLEDDLTGTTNSYEQLKADIQELYDLINSFDPAHTTKDTTPKETP